MGLSRKIFKNTGYFLQEIVRSKIVLQAILVGLISGLLVVLFKVCINELFGFIQTSLAPFDLLHKLLIFPVITTIGGLISGILVFDDLINQTDEEIIHELTSFRGIGTWTAKMFLIFGLNRPDVLPYEDAAFLQSYKWMYKTSDCSKESIMKRCKKWKPYSSIAARYLYRALDYGLTKDEFHLFK